MNTGHCPGQLGLRKPLASSLKLWFADCCVEDAPRQTLLKHSPITTATSDGDDTHSHAASPLPAGHVMSDDSASTGLVTQLRRVERQMDKIESSLASLRDIHSSMRRRCVSKWGSLCVRALVGPGPCRSKTGRKRKRSCNLGIVTPIILHPGKHPTAVRPKL